jgi:hypothetical protein
MNYCLTPGQTVKTEVRAIYFQGGRLRFAQRISVKQFSGPILSAARLLARPIVRSQCLAETELRFGSESSSALQLRKTSPVF